MKKIWMLVLTSMLCAFGGGIGATTITFTYTGTDVGCATCTQTGTGSFSFNDSPLSIGLGDLTAFSFTDTYTNSAVPFSTTFSYTLANLLSFSASLDAAQNLLALSFETAYVAGSNGFLLPQAVIVESLASARTQDCHEIKGGCIVATITEGFITVTSVPEPPTLALLSTFLVITFIGYAGSAFERRLQGRRPAPHEGEQPI